MYYGNDKGESTCRHWYRYNYSKTIYFTPFRMIIMIVLVAVMAISRNSVLANHRISHKHRTSYSNSINDIPLDFGEELSPFGNEHGRVVNINFSGNNKDNGIDNTDVYGNTLPMGSTNFLDDSSYVTATPARDTEDDLLRRSDGFGGDLIPSGNLQKLGSSINSIEMPEEPHNGAPYFDLAASKNVTSLLGKTAYLNCRVKNLGNKTMLLQVSWVRHRDIHLLTVGRYTYTTDQRFRAIHQPQTEDWMLQIKYTQHRDAGIYECQVSTTPHMSHYIHLNIVEPSTEIIGAPDMYIESGSTINLTCVIFNSPEPPAYMFWNHNNAIINYDSPRGGVSVVTLKGETTTSFLLIKSARSSDSGHYQCNPSNAKPKSVTVHVLNGASHSVSRGVPSSNAARDNISSSSAARTNMLCLSLLLLLHIDVLHLLHTNARGLVWWQYKLLQLLCSSADILFRWLLLLNIHTRRPEKMYRKVNLRTVICHTQQQ